MSDLKVQSYRSTLTIEDKVYADELEMMVSHQFADDDVHIFLIKHTAEQIVNHLITVFDITPEQRNK